MPSKLEILRLLALKDKGAYGAQRVERAADEIKNLTKLYSPDALKYAFFGDNAKALMTMNPKDFEKYSSPLEFSKEYRDKMIKLGLWNTDNNIDYDRIQKLRKIRGGFDDVPYLVINKSRPTNLFALPPVEELPTTPFISGHEGRHRNRAMAESGEQAGLVRLEPRAALREGFPRRSQEAYIEALRQELGLTGNKVKPEISYEGNTPIHRPEIDLPPIYKQGGAVNMGGGGRVPTVLQMLKELASKGSSKAAPAGSLGMNAIKKGSQEITNNEILEKFWKALDNAGDGHIGVRSDDAIVNNSFKKSWNRPDGVKTTRLPGTSVVYVGYDNITKDSLMNAIKNSRTYGKNIYLVEGESPNSIQHLANDPGERLITENKILSSIINTPSPDEGINLPEIYKNGGLVNMAGGGRTGAALSIGQMLKELVSKGNVAPVSRIDMGYKDVSQRVPELTIAANLLKAGKISADDYAQLVNALKPVTPYAFVPKPATRSEAMNALMENKRQGYGGTSKIEGGERVDARLDIPAYTEHGVWVDSIHRAGFPTSYSSTSSVNNPRIVIPQDKALKVATGEKSKSPFAVMRGEWNPLSEKEAVKLAQKSLNNPDWVQVGIDPERHAYGYDRKTMQPVIDGEQMVQVGPLVLVKNPVYGDTSEFKFAGGGEVSQDAMRMAVMNQKVQHKVRGGLNLAEMRKSAQDLWDIAKGTRSKEAQVAAGLYHPIGGGVKLSTPVPLMDFKTIKDPNVKMAPIKIITPEDLYKGRGIPLLGDRALAGRIVTEIGGKKVNVVGEGGPNYLRTHSRKDPAISAAWASGDEKTTNLAKLAGETGDPVYGINVIGSATMGDFNTMVTKAILDQYDPSSVSAANKKAFLKVLQNYIPDPKKPHLIPGADFVGMDNVDVMREQLMAPGAGNLRKAFVDRLDKFRDMGFPDVAHARLATMEPALVDSPLGMAGFTVAKMDTSGNIIAAPVRGHTTYPVPAGGSYYGSLDEPVDYQDIFQRFGLYRRGEGANPNRDYRSFSMSPQIQDFDNQWLDNIMKTLGRDKPSVSEYKDGGAVNMKGGSLVDELIAESKGKTSSDVKPQMSRQSEFEKDFERYLASQQAAREQVAQDIGIGSGAFGAGFGIQAAPPVALADLVGMFLPESVTKNTYYPSTENITEHLNELAKKHLNQYANPIDRGLEAGELAGIPAAMRGLKKMGKAVVSAGGKVLANAAGEITGLMAPIKYPSNRPAVSEMYAGGGEVTSNPKERGVEKKVKGGLERLSRYKFNEIKPRLQIFIGSKSDLYNTGGESVAKAMEAAGKSPEDIWMQTKTFRGADGKWRQEISDKDSKFFNAAAIKGKADAAKEFELAIRQKIEDSKAHPDLFPKQLTQAQKELRGQAKVSKANRTSEFGLETDPEMQGNSLNIALGHPTLYDAYPELKNVVVNQGGDGGGDTLGQLTTAGGFSAMDIFNAGLRKDPRSTALHEAQHAIQNIEGWSPGGSSRMAFQNKEAFDILNDMRARAKIPLPFDVYAKNGGWDSPESATRDYNKYVKGLKTISPENDRIFQGEAAKLYYKRLAGETEARAVQDRMDFTDAQLSERPPSTDYEFQIDEQIVKPPFKMANGGGITSDDLILEERPL